MKKITKVLPKYTVEETTVIKYETEDGLVYDTEKEATIHEELLARKKEFEKVKHTGHLDLCSMEYVLNFYYAADEHDLQLIIKNLHLEKDRHTSQDINGEIKIGEWIGEYTDTSGDYNYQHIYTLSEIKKNLEKDLEVINQII